MMFALTVATLPLLAQSTGTNMKKSCHETTPTPGLDAHGNPVGRNYDLGGSDFDADGAKILIINLLAAFDDKFLHRFSEATNALEDKGFNVTMATFRDVPRGKYCHDSPDQKDVKFFNMKTLKYITEDCKTKWKPNYNVRFFSVTTPEQTTEYNSVRNLLYSEQPSQLWIIDSDKVIFLDDDVKAINDYYNGNGEFNGGGSLFLWADNDSFNQNVNILAQNITGATVSGDYVGNRNVTKYDEETGEGLKDVAVMTGINRLYSGHTVAAIKFPTDDRKDNFTPIINIKEIQTCKFKRSSGGWKQYEQSDCEKEWPNFPITPFASPAQYIEENIITAAQYEEETENGRKKKLIIDGAFTRGLDNHNWDLFHMDNFYSHDSVSYEFTSLQGNGRYIKNCAVWLSGYKE